VGVIIKIENVNKFIKKMEIELEQGKIYYLDYGSNTQVVGRLKILILLNTIFTIYYIIGMVMRALGKETNIVLNQVLRKCVEHQSLKFIIL